MTAEERKEIDDLRRRVEELERCNPPTSPWTPVPSSPWPWPYQPSPQPMDPHPYSPPPWGWRDPRFIYGVGAPQVWWDGGPKWLCVNAKQQVTPMPPAPTPPPYQLAPPADRQRVADEACLVQSVVDARQDGADVLTIPAAAQ
jgi:hypothetical protein